MIQLPGFGLAIMMTTNDFLVEHSDRNFFPLIAGYLVYQLSFAVARTIQLLSRASYYKYANKSFKITGDRMFQNSLK